MRDFTVVIPTYNGGELWGETVQSILNQTVAPEKVIVIDSASTDQTASLAEGAGFIVQTISKDEFDHGGTRTKALRYVNSELVVFLTQDAVLNDSSAFENLIAVFSDKKISTAYGRQIPHYDATPMASYARKNSYGEKSYVTSLEDNYPQGFRKAFLSNSFSAYRMSTLLALGGFPEKLILGEDSYIAAKLLLSGGKVAYVANAVVRHSHNYTISEEFKRYFDIGVFHSTQRWMLKELGSVEGEGIRFAVGQVNYIISRGSVLTVPVSVLTSIAKYFGYRLGRTHTKLPLGVCRRLSMHKGYWTS